MAEAFLESFFVGGNADAVDAPLRRMNLASRQRPGMTNRWPQTGNSITQFFLLRVWMVQLFLLV